MACPSLVTLANIIDPESEGAVARSADMAI